jgi:hypothetical protein
MEQLTLLPMVFLEHLQLAFLAVVIINFIVKVEGEGEGRERGRERVERKV